LSRETWIILQIYADLGRKMAGIDKFDFHRKTLPELVGKTCFSTSLQLFRASQNPLTLVDTWQRGRGFPRLVTCDLSGGKKAGWSSG